MKIIIVSGWASPKESLSVLSNSFAASSDVQTVSMHSLPELKKGIIAYAGLPAPSDYALGLMKLIGDAGDNCILIGWSTGGMVVLEAALHCMDKIDGIVLAGTASRFSSGDDYNIGTSPSVLRAMISGIRKDAGTTLINFLVNSHKPFVEDAALVQNEADAASLIGNEELIAGLQYLWKTDLRGSLGEIDIPSLVIHGKEDLIIPWQAGSFLANKLHNASFRLIDGAGHDLPIRFAELIADEARRFIKTI